MLKCLMYVLPFLVWLCVRRACVCLVDGCAVYLLDMGYGECSGN